jgi:hypothetical protein
MKFVVKFEWDFFGETLIDSYIQELLTTLHSTPDYLNSLHTDTADALMTICATNVESVVQAYISTKSNFQFLIEILYKLPRSKSFHYQALLLEIVYRMHRQLKKHDGSRELNSMGKKLIEALPHEISKELVKISPKVWHYTIFLEHEKINASFATVEIQRQYS